MMFTDLREVNGNATRKPSIHSGLIIDIDQHSYNIR